MSTVRCWISLILVWPCLAFVVGCTRPNGGGTSHITIQAPQNFGKVGVFAVPANRKACWGANVTGDGVNGVGATGCSPATGVVAGYKVSGQNITAEVPKGLARKVDLYLYLLPPNNNSPCPTMTASFPAAQLSDTYLVGSVTADFTLDTTTVEIAAVFPGENNHLAVTAALPATCLPTAGPTRPASIRSAGGTISGDGKTIKARVGSFPGATKMSAGGITMEVK